jgi:hypothetical protein
MTEENNNNEFNIPFQDEIFTSKKTGFQIKIDKETRDYFLKSFDLFAEFKKIAIKDNQDIEDVEVIERLKSVTEQFRDKKINKKRAYELIRNEGGRQGIGAKGTSKNTKLTPKNGSI